MRRITIGAQILAGLRGRTRMLALLIGALVGLGALGTLTVAVVQSQDRARQDALARFDDRGELAAQLLAGAMGQSSTRQAADAQLRLSGRVTAATLRAWEGESDPAIPYTALYDDRGRELAIYPIGARAVATPPGRAALQVATSGRPATSGVISTPRGPIIESFVPFPAGDGFRVLLVAFPLEFTAQFAAGTLRDAAGTPTGGAFVLDRSGALVTAVGKGSKLPGVSEAVVAAARQGRAGGNVNSTRYILRPVSGTGLLVALAAPEEELTADLPAVLWPRLALGGFGLALLGVFWLTVRALRDARRLEAARDEADRANEAKSRFLSHISHELRTPLTAMTGFAELLQEREGADETERQWVARILRGGEHLLALVKELDEIARIEAGKMALAIEPVDVRAVVDEVLGLAAPLAAERGIRLEPPVDGLSDRHALADPMRLRQVLLNLISNAIKYNREAGAVSVSLEETNGTVRVAVTDTGEGIPRDRLESLFKPFERLGAEHGPIEGSGLGLVVTKGLVEAMHGRLEVESEVGAGTTFAFELPAEDAAADQTERAPIPAPVAIGATAGKVLYIDDNPTNLQLVESILADMRPGLELRTALNGAAGTALAEQRRPDLLLLDLNLPDMTGEKVLRRLRARAETADLPVLILSADSTSRNVTRLLQTGADAYLTKPLDVRQFLDVVDRLISTR